jgi:hypothetical protein
MRFHQEASFHPRPNHAVQQSYWDFGRNLPHGGRCSCPEKEAYTAGHEVGHVRKEKAMDSLDVVREISMDSCSSLEALPE